MGDTDALLLFGILCTSIFICVAQPSHQKLSIISMSGARLKMMMTRNMYQCERLCLRYKPCVSVSYSTRSRSCFLYSEEFADISRNREEMLSTGLSIEPVFCEPSDCPNHSICVPAVDKAICLITEGPLDEPVTTARDCQEVLEANSEAPDGVYIIRPQGSDVLWVYCDMTDAEGGWTVFQRRADGSEIFNRTWQDYKNGFGNLENEFWLGNDNLFHLTNQKKNHLKIVMKDFENQRTNASYSTFYIEDESDNYRLTIGGYNGSAGDSFSYHNNMSFSTSDADNDIIKTNCANKYRGAWWYRGCHMSNLNGEYNNTNRGEGVNWGFRGFTYSLEFVEMKIRSKS